MANLLRRLEVPCLRKNASVLSGHCLKRLQTILRHESPSWNSSRQRFCSTTQWPRRTILSSSCTARYGLVDLGTMRSLHTRTTLLQPSQTPDPNSKKAVLHQQMEQQEPSTRSGVDRPQYTTQETTPDITDRLADARERTKDVAKRVKSSLTPHENIYNLPNLLTVSRLFAAPLTAYLLVHDQHTWALAVFAYAGITDLVDGWMARKWKLQTVAGSVIDPMADKALMIIVTVTLAAKGAIPAYLATLILGRDAALAIAAIWYRYASLPAPKTFARYWDFSLPSAEVHPTTVSKYNTFLQLVLIGSTLALPVITADNHHFGMLHDLGLGKVDLHQALLGLQILVAGTTVWSGLSYAFLKNAVTIIGSNETLKARQGAIGRAIIGVSFGAIVLIAAYLGTNELQQETEESTKKDKIVS